MSKRTAIAALMMICSTAHGEGVVHLTFHIAAGAEQQFKVGTTIENKGDDSVYGGYMVIIPVAEKCKPLRPVFKPYGTLMPGEKKNLEITIGNHISGYRIAGIYAYDEYGYPLKVMDETREIMEKREEEQKKKCSIDNPRGNYKIID
ncbi:TPA: membrane-associated Zn-dependent protease 1 [Enterobacter asburiae]